MHSSGIGIRISIKMYLLLYDVVGGVVGMDRFHPGVKLKGVGTILYGRPDSSQGKFFIK